MKKSRDKKRDGRGEERKVKYWYDDTRTGRKYGSQGKKARMNKTKKEKEREVGGNKKEKLQN